MFSVILSVLIASVVCYLFLSFLSFCKAMNDAIDTYWYEAFSNMSRPETDLKVIDPPDDLFAQEFEEEFDRPYVGWSQEEIDWYEKNCLRYDVLGY